MGFAGGCGIVLGVYVRIICITREYRGAARFAFFRFLFLFFVGDPRYAPAVRDRLGRSGWWTLLKRVNYTHKGSSRP